jgi:hypothetical protein
MGDRRFGEQHMLQCPLLLEDASSTVSCNRAFNVMQLGFLLVLFTASTLLNQEWPENSMRACGDANHRGLARLGSLFSDLHCMCWCGIGMRGADMICKLRMLVWRVAV